MNLGDLPTITGLLITAHTILANRSRLFTNKNFKQGLPDFIPRDFILQVSETLLANLRDINYPMPIANVQYKQSIDKNHGFKNHKK